MDQQAEVRPPKRDYCLVSVWLDIIALYRLDLLQPKSPQIEMFRLFYFTTFMAAVWLIREGTRGEGTRGEGHN